ncbi:MAG: hypothetical protein E6R08_04285 [Nevskiaceae bacterium]|nr:MAG: hypothetical protein E6R08_04285 [Nevskiaceae bacterium]
MAVEIERPIFVGTVSYLLSHRSYPDFIKGGLNVNQLPLLSDAISTIQEALEKIQPIELRHRGGTAAPRDLKQYSPIEPFGFTIQSVFVESVSFESGSVYAKVKIAAAVAFVAYQGLADYKDVKEGFSELRRDVINIVTNAFGVDGAGPVEGDQPQDNADLRFYFTQPRRIEEEVLRRRVAPSREA